MPVNKYYEVEQTRTVKIRANSAIEAANMANAVFEKGPEAAQDHILGQIEVTRLDISKDL